MVARALWRSEALRVVPWSSLHSPTALVPGSPRRVTGLKASERSIIK